MQVNLIGTAGIQADGRLLIDPLQGMTLGDLVCRHAYDAMGRLMWRRTPTNEGFSQLQRKDYYYDGVRRIQENIARPSSLSQGGGGASGGGGSGGGSPAGPEQLGGPGNDELPLDTQGGSAALECAAFPASQGQLPGGGVPPPIDPPVLECEEPEQINTLRWTDREYVYGPGYVDEFILQIDQSGNLLYMLQDANYNVVAIISGGCVSGDCGAGVPPVGTLLEQYAYEPYGTVIAADNLDVDQFGVTRHAVNRVGFQGLFFERYDGSYFEPSIAPGVAGMYYARNRFYSPALGRFLQRDPNETGLPIITALAMNGEAAAILFSGFNGQGLYADGMNLYLFAGGNPVMWRDPSGLNSAGAVGSLGLGALLYTTALEVGYIALAAVAKVKGIALAYAWMMTAFMLMASNNTPAISTAVAEYGEDYVHLDRIWQTASNDPRTQKAFEQTLENVSNSGQDPFQDWNDKFEKVYNGIKDWNGWDPAFKKVSEKADRIKDPRVLRTLHNTLEGKWNKVYMYGRDGREIHCFRHASGKIVNPKWVD